MTVCKVRLSPVLLCSVQGMSNDDIQNLQKVVDEQIQENMGMSMIYTIVSAAQEWMQEKVTAIDNHEQDLAMQDVVFQPGSCCLPALACSAPILRVSALCSFNPSLTHSIEFAML